MSPTVLSQAMGGRLPMSEYERLAEPFTDALQQADCTTVDRVAMFCAQVGHESSGLYYREEIASGEAYEGRSDLGNTQPGDGRRFKGRGPIQLTGRHNYTRMSQWAAERGYVKNPRHFVDRPSDLELDRYLFLGVVWYWTVARDMNAHADRRDIVGATRAVNGGTNGLEDRISRWERCLKIGRPLLDGSLDTDRIGESLAATKKARARQTGRIKDAIRKITKKGKP